jgi:hypothetical protein
MVARRHFQISISSGPAPLSQLQRVWHLLPVEHQFLKRSAKPINFGGEDEITFS